MHRLLHVTGLLICAILAACTPLTPAPRDPARQVLALLPADAILLGEQHDAAAHQALQRESVEALGSRGLLAALALEMAEQGRATTGLPRDATEAQVRTALDWQDKAWPWQAYGPVVMAAVRAGVSVFGANLPRSAMREAMSDPALDALLTPQALQTQRERIRVGHCELLPASQIGPMTRIQIARDRAMARTVQGLARPGQVVVLVAGAGHVERELGVPRHLERGLRVKVVVARAGGAPRDLPAAMQAQGMVDLFLDTPALPERDHCEGLRRSR